MKILGAIIAGGKSRRFGSDKVLAAHDGRRLIDIVADGLHGQVADIIVCGRIMHGWESLPDRPVANLGPLGGLCAALHYARHKDYDAVLSVAADVLPIPAHLVEWLSVEKGPVVVEGQHLLGLWPVSLAADLDCHLEQCADRSLRAWITASSAVRIVLPIAFANINTVEDLARLD